MLQKTLLTNMIRSESKIQDTIANVIRERIQDRIDRYVRPNQISYRRGRSTTEMAWAGQYLATMIQRFEDGMGPRKFSKKKKNPRSALKKHSHFLLRNAQTNNSRAPLKVNK